MELYETISYLLLGTFIGFASGLLGIGGGFFLVPSLTMIFLWQKMPDEIIIQTAIGTSMACIVFISATNLLAHKKKKKINWYVIKSMTPTMIIGAFLATFLVSALNKEWLLIIFLLILMFSCFILFLDIKPTHSKKLPNLPKLSLVGTIIGAMSAMGSIGGGSLLSPYLIWHNIPIKNSISTSAAIAFPISVASSIGYFINGTVAIEQKVDFLFGFIHVFAVIIISLASMVTVPIGTNLAHNIPAKKLKRIFSIFLLMICIYFFQKLL